MPKLSSSTSLQFIHVRSYLSYSSKQPRTYHGKPFKLYMHQRLMLTRLAIIPQQPFFLHCHQQPHSYTSNTNIQSTIATSTENSRSDHHHLSSNSYNMESSKYIDKHQPLLQSNKPPSLSSQSSNTMHDQSSSELERILSDSSVPFSLRLQQAIWIELKLLFYFAASAVVVYMINYLMSMSTQIFVGYLGNLELAATSICWQHQHPSLCIRPHGNHEFN